MLCQCSLYFVAYPFEPNKLNTKIHPISAVRLASVPTTTISTLPGDKAQFEVDLESNLIQMNWQGSLLLETNSVFGLQGVVLLPKLLTEQDPWRLSINQCCLQKQPKMMLLGSFEGRVPVLIQPSDQHSVLIKAAVGDGISQEMMNLVCSSLGVTVTEKEVLRQLLRGIQPKVIAQSQNRTEATIRSHIKCVLAKFQCRSIQELIAVFMRLPTQLKS